MVLTDCYHSEVDHEEGYDFDGIVGYDFGGFRLESEVAYKAAGVDSTNASCCGNPNKSKRRRAFCDW